MAIQSIKSFIQSDSGAVTVDWVVLTAAIMGLGVAVISVVSGGVQNLSTSISDELTNTQPLTSPFTPEEEAPEEGG